jgi:hypothetical protein
VGQSDAQTPRAFPVNAKNPGCSGEALPRYIIAEYRWANASPEPL